MMQPGHTIWLRWASSRFPGVKAKVMVIAAGRQEQNVAGGTPARHIARLHHHIESKYIDIESANAINVGGAQMNVPDYHAWVDWSGGRCARHDCALHLL